MFSEDESCAPVLTPVGAIKTKRVKKHILQNDAPKHNNKKRNVSFNSFLKNSPCMIKKINLMRESETRYRG
jgi:hypothetical protein